MLPKIEKGIPMPEGFRHSQRGSKYPFKNMEIGDSIVMPSTREDTTGCNGVSAAHGYGKRHGMKFASSYIGDYQVRIWRTA